MTTTVITHIGELTTHDHVADHRRRRGRRRGQPRSRGSAPPPTHPRPTSRSTPAAGRSSPASSTATATWSSRATARRSSRPGWPGSPTPRAGSGPPSRPPAPPPTSSSPATSPGWSARCDARARPRWRSRAATASASTTRPAAWRWPGSSRTRPPSSGPTSSRRRTPTAGDPAAYVDLVTGPMLEACAPYARWIDVFCEDGAFDVDQARTVLEAGAAAGLRGRLHANQLTYGEGVRLAAELGLTAVDHCTYLTDDDVAALADSGTVATLLPGVEFSTRQPYPDARRLLDAGVTVAIASDCNPGSCFTSSMPVLHRARGARDGDDARRGALVGDGRRRPRPRPRRRRRDRSGQACRPRAARRAVARPPRLPARRPARRRGLAGRPPGVSVSRSEVAAGRAARDKAPARCAGLPQTTNLVPRPPHKE